MSPMLLLLLCMAILLLFGSRLPAAVRSLGRGMHEFLNGMAEFSGTLAGPQGEGDDPPTSGGVFARIKPHPSGGTAA